MVLGDAPLDVLDGVKLLDVEVLNVLAMVADVVGPSEVVVVPHLPLQATI